MGVSCSSGPKYIINPLHRWHCKYTNGVWRTVYNEYLSLHSSSIHIDNRTVYLTVFFIINCKNYFSICLKFLVMTSITELKW